jgi:glycosyltransferase involved in cell wall biosynthesis
MQKDRSAAPEKKIKINWEGSLFVHHSLGMVNREILAELIKSPMFDIRHIPFESNQFEPDAGSKYYPLTTIAKGPHTDADIHIRHKWPPDFNRPPSGKFIVMQPWEYGSLPVSWLHAMNDCVDEIWVYTRYLKTCYERSGVHPDKIKIVPLGIDPVLFNPDAAPLPQVIALCGNRYRFLYNGGVTLRKGTDILVNAYLAEFTPDDPVCLFIKDSDVYGKGMAVKIKELAARDDIAKIIYTSDSIPHERLPCLYTSCDCYVHPYRAEGYGLPIAEAMACGIPVIVTGGGACLDFVEPDGGYFVKCALESIPTKKVGNLDTIDCPFWLVPDMSHLRSVLRYVYTNRTEARERGRAAGTTMRSVHTWKNTAAIAGQYIVSLIAPSIHASPATDLANDKDELIDRAVSLLRSGAYTEATGFFQKILHKYGENSLAYEGLAIAAFHRKNYDEACNLFAAANRISPATVDITINWYEAAKLTGSVQELIQPVRKALETDNENDDLRAIAVEMGLL